MECSICKREFGNGETCQHCGADRFTGLGNYSGYETPTNISHNKTTVDNTFSQTEQKVVSQPQAVTVESMVCHACGEIIPADSKFCPYCSILLWVKCPKCGKTYSSQFPACNECGTNRQDYLKEQQQIAQRRDEERLREERIKREKIERERREHEEWLKTPEGKAETERQKKEAAEKERRRNEEKERKRQEDEKRKKEQERKREQEKREQEIKELKNRASQITDQCKKECRERQLIGIFGGLFTMGVSICIALILSPVQGAEIFVGLFWLLAVACLVLGIYSLLLTPEKEIEQYKQLHPDDPVINYL